MSDSGVLVVDKPAGITSHQVVARARRAFGTKRIGHAGTLDPMATGVLVLGVERATRLLGHLALTDKAYDATIRLGQATVTDDAEGEPTASAGADGLTRAEIEAALPAFRGAISQVPSAVSAIKVGGQRSYARVRRGEDVALAARAVTVGRFDLLDVRPADADGVRVLDVDVTVECSSGTYIRALARDLGAALGTGGHLTALRRTRVGPFALADAGWDAAPDSAAPRLMTMADAARLSFATREIDADAARDVRYGRSLALALDGLTGLLHDGELLGLYEPREGRAAPVAVLV